MFSGQCLCWVASETGSPIVIGVNTAELSPAREEPVTKAREQGMRQSLNYSMYQTVVHFKNWSLPLHVHNNFTGISASCILEASWSLLGRVFPCPKKGERPEHPDDPKL